MVSKSLAISLVVVSVVAAADMLLKRNPPEVNVQSTPSPKPSSKLARHASSAISASTFENPLAHRAPKDFAVISERTLFSSTRRAKQEVEPTREIAIVEPMAIAVQPQPLPDPNDFTLVGVAAANGQRIALLRWNKTQEVVRLRSGDDYTGWKIAQVNDRSVLVEQQGSVFSLKLFKGRTAAEAIVDPD